MPILTKKLEDGQLMSAMSDPRVPMKARGMLATLQNMEVGEEFTLEGMANAVPDGYTAILSAVRTLEDLGYLERRSIYGERGHITHSEYLLFADDGARDGRA